MVVRDTSGRRIPRRVREGYDVPTGTGGARRVTPEETKAVQESQARQEAIARGERYVPIRQNGEIVGYEDLQTQQSISTTEYQKRNIPMSMATQKELREKVSYTPRIEKEYPMSKISQEQLRKIQLESIPMSRISEQELRRLKAKQEGYLPTAEYYIERGFEKVGEYAEKRGKVYISPTGIITPTIYFLPHKPLWMKEIASQPTQITKKVPQIITKTISKAKTVLESIPKEEKEKLKKLLFGYELPTSLFIFSICSLLNFSSVFNKACIWVLSIPSTKTLFSLKPDIFFAVSLSMETPKVISKEPFFNSVILVYNGLWYTSVLNDIIISF